MMIHLKKKKRDKKKEMNSQRNGKSTIIKEGIEASVSKNWSRPNGKYISVVISVSVSFCNKLLKQGTFNIASVQSSFDANEDGDE